MKTCATRLGRLGLERVGEGAPVVLWPGLFFDAGQLRGLARGLARAGHEVVLLDPPGFGASEPLAGRFSMEACGEALLEVLDGLGLQEAVLGGTSWGGIAAAEAARRAPHRVRALVLMNTPLGPGSRRGMVGQVPRLAGLLPWGLFVRGAAGSLFGASSLRTRPGLVETLRAGLERSSHRSVRLAAESVLWAREGLGEVLPRLRAPTLLLAGDEDGLYPAQDARAVAERMEAGHFVLVQGTGHSSALEDPEATTARVLHFLSQVAPGARAQSAQGAPAQPAAALGVARVGQ